MKKRITTTQPLHRLNIRISRDIAIKLNTQAALEDKTVELKAQELLEVGLQPKP